MATARKRSSGNYRAKVFSYKDADGKPHYESFTAPTKQEAELMAAKFKADKKKRQRCEFTVIECIRNYISAKEDVLSPSTIRSYRQMERTRFSDIGGISIKRLTSEDIQRWVSKLSTSVSPKTVANVYGLLTSSIALFNPDFNPKVTLPKRIKERRISPSDEAIQALYEAASPNLKKAIALSAGSSLRRGEICALTYEDLQGDTLYIHRDMVQNSKNEWIVKDFPKTADSVRKVRISPEVIELLGNGKKDEKIVPVLPSTLTTEFVKIRNRLRLDIRFHDLRHYFASVGAVLNIPRVYMEDFGGWQRGSSVLSSVYENNLVSMSDIYADRMNQRFTEVLYSRKYSRENEKAANEATLRADPDGNRNRA